MSTELESSLMCGGSRAAIPGDLRGKYLLQGRVGRPRAKFFCPRTRPHSVPYVPPMAGDFLPY